MTDELLRDLDGGVLRLTINRPERRNAMTWEVVRELRSAMAGARLDDDVRVVVLCGAGDAAFCAGADLGSMHGQRGKVSGKVSGKVNGQKIDQHGVGFLPLHESRGELAALFVDMWHLGKPTLSRVQGWAMAGGFGLAVACDLVVASTRARFGAPEIDVGLWPYMITVPLMRSMAPKHALELMLTGRVVGASEAKELGFVNRVVSHDDLDAATDELACTLAAKSSAGMKLGREAFYSVWDMAAPEALAHMHAMLTITTQTEDAAEGAAAFSAKRPPRWRGR